RRDQARTAHGRRLPSIAPSAARVRHLLGRRSNSGVSRSVRECRLPIASIPFGQRSFAQSRIRPAMNICGKALQIRGGVVRIARLAAERYEYFDDPAGAIAAVRAVRRRIDLFTFIQPPAEPSPAYDYPMEWDNIAAVPVTTFDRWWKQQINGKTRNMI